MQRNLCGPLALLAALWGTPLVAEAAEAPKKEEPAAEGEDEDMVIIEDEMEGEAAPAEGEKGEAPASEGGGTDLEFLDEGSSSKTDVSVGSGSAPSGTKRGKQDKDSEQEQIKTDSRLISVVQRQRMLKKKRLDIQPQFGISVNDPYIRHYAIGGEFTYWITNRIGIGLIGNANISVKTPRYNNIKSQEGILITANRVIWQAGLNFSYAPFYGKITLFNSALMHWETFVQLGGGALQTQIVPRFGDTFEPFSTFTGGGHFGLGARLYMPKPVDWMSVNAGVRTWVYPDKLEPYERGPDTDPANDVTLKDAGRAKAAAESTLGWNSVFYVGLSFYFPPTFEYSTPR